MSETRTLLENIGTALYYADGWQLPVGVVTLLRDCKSALEQAERSEPAAASVPLPNCICPTTYAHGMIIPIADGDCPRCFPKTAEAPEGAAPAGVTAPIDPIYFMSKMLEGLAAGDADKSLAYARHYIEQLEASGSASQAKRLRDAMDGTARMVGLAAPAGAHCNDCTDPHCHGAAPAVSREAEGAQDWDNVFTPEDGDLIAMAARYTDHEQGCAYDWQKAESVCDCGLWELLGRLAKRLALASSAAGARPETEERS
jgi:hypothetical protein